MMNRLIFCDGTFYSCPMIAYQLLITRVFDIIKDSYCTTSFAIMKDKSIENYKKFFLG